MNAMLILPKKTSLSPYLGSGAFCFFTLDMSSHLTQFLGHVKLQKVTHQTFDKDTLLKKILREQHGIRFSQVSIFIYLQFVKKYLKKMSQHSGRTGRRRCYKELLDNEHYSLRIQLPPPSTKKNIHNIGLNCSGNYSFYGIHQT